MPQQQGARLSASRLYPPHAAKTMQSRIMLSDRLSDALIPDGWLSLSHATGNMGTQDGGIRSEQRRVSLRLSVPIGNKYEKAACSAFG